MLQSFVRYPQAPISNEEWGEKSIQDRVAYLINYQPDDDSIHIRDISPKGLSELFRKDLDDLWLEYVPEIERLIQNTIFPIYIQTVLEHISQLITKCNEKKKPLESDYDLNIFVDIIKIKTLL